MLSVIEEEKLKNELYELRAERKIRDKLLHDLELDYTELKAKYYSKYSARDDQINKSIIKYLLEIIVFLLKIIGGGAIIAGMAKIFGLDVGDH